MSKSPISTFYTQFIDNLLPNGHKLTLYIYKVLAFYTLLPGLVFLHSALLEMHGTQH